MKAQRASTASAKGADTEDGMEDLETKKLRDSLVEYESHLSEMRQVTLKNVETLDVIQRYTDKSAAGMQKLAEQSLDGVQKVTAESAGGLRRIIETGTSNVNRMAESGEAGIRSLEKNSKENIDRITQENLAQLQNFMENGLTQIHASVEKNQETAAEVEKIEQAILKHMEEMKALMKQSDDFTHRENVKVYRNVQAVVVDEVKKQTESLAAANEELLRRSDALAKQNKGLKPLMIVTLLAALANIALIIAQIAGLF